MLLESLLICFQNPKLGPVETPGYISCSIVQKKTIDFYQEKPLTKEELDELNEALSLTRPLWTERGILFDSACLSRSYAELSEICNYNSIG